MNAILQKNTLDASWAALKQASVGSSPDVPYEQALANIAHDYLRSRAPTLLDYEIGFQLIDKSRGGEKSLGAFGFKVGDRTLIVPVVYYDGEVSGHEIIFVVDQNICVPSTEAWVNYLTQKQPDSIGTQVAGNRGSLGIRGAPLSLITRSPLKYASEQNKAVSQYPEWCQPFVKWFAKIAVSKEEERLTWAPGISDYLKNQPPEAYEKYLLMLNNYPAIKSAAEKMNQNLYEELEKSIDAAVDRSRLPRIFGSVLGEPKKEEALKIISYTEVTKSIVPYDLTDSEQEKLIQQGYIVKDKRKDSQKPKAYLNPVNQETLQLQHPLDNCIDNVLVRPGKFERCLVLSKMVSPTKLTAETAVIRLSGKATRIDHRHSFLVENDPVDMGELSKFVDKLPEAEDFSFAKGKDYVLLFRKGNSLQASCVFSVDRDMGKQGKDRVLAVSSCCSFMGESRSPIGGDISPSQHMSDKLSGYKKSKPQVRICCDAENIKAWQDELVVPEDARVLAVDVLEYSDKDKFQPGDMRDLASIMWKGLAKLDVRRAHSAGREYSIDQKELVSKSAAIHHLVKTHLLAEDDAEAILDSVPVGSSAVFGIRKAANPTPWLIDEGKAQGPDFPWESNTGGNWMANPNVENDSTIRYQIPVEGMMASANDPTQWDPKEEPNQPFMQQALQAANQGQRDVFNVKSILSMANKDQSGDMGPIITCMDALGRRYIAFRWQREDMNDQYGTADASEIEESLLNNFESLGEMIIAMYERDLRNGDRTETLEVPFNGSLRRCRGCVVKVVNENIRPRSVNSAPDWRWLRAEYLRKARKRTLAAETDRMVQAAMDLMDDMDSCTSDFDWDDLYEDKYDEMSAYSFWIDPAIFRNNASTIKLTPTEIRRQAAMEAYLLTGASYEEVSNRMGTTPKAVELYENWFFDFRSRMHLPHWISTNGFRGDVAGQNGIVFEHMLRMFGYNHGISAVDELLRGTQYSESTRKAMRQDQYDHLLKSGAISARLQFSPVSTLEAARGVMEIEDRKRQFDLSAGAEFKDAEQDNFFNTISKDMSDYQGAVVNTPADVESQIPREEKRLAVQLGYESDLSVLKTDTSSSD